MPADNGEAITLATMAAMLNALLIAQGQPPRELLTIDEAAMALGIKRVLLYSLIQRGELDSVVIGERARRVPVSEVSRFVARKLAEARGELIPAPLPVAPAAQGAKGRTTGRQKAGRRRRGTRRKTG